MRTNQEDGRKWIAWVKAFLEAKRAGRAGSLLAVKQTQLKLNFGGEQPCGYIYQQATISINTKSDSSHQTESGIPNRSGIYPPMRRSR